MQLLHGQGPPAAVADVVLEGDRQVLEREQQRNRVRLLPQHAQGGDAVRIALEEHTQGGLESGEAQLVEPKRPVQRVPSAGLNQLLLARQDAGLGPAKQLVAREAHQVGAVCEHIAHDGLVTEAREEGPAAQVLDQRRADRRELPRLRPLGESEDSEVARMHAQERSGLFGDGVGVIGGTGPIGRPDLDQRRPTQSHDLRHPKAASNLDEFASGADDLPPVGQRSEGEHDRRGVVVDGDGVLAADELPQRTADAVETPSPLAGGHVELGIRVPAGDLSDRLSRLGSQGSAAEVRVQHDARSVDHATKPLAGQRHNAGVDQRGDIGKLRQPPSNLVPKPTQNLARGAGCQRPSVPLQAGMLQQGVHTRELTKQRAHRRECILPGPMNAVIYLLVSALAGVLAWRAWSRERGDPVRRDFAVLCAISSATYLCFSLFLFPGITAARFPFAVLGAFVPVSTLQFLETFLARQGDRDPVVLRRLWALTPLVVAGYISTDLLFFGNDASAAWPEVVLGILVYAGFCTALYRLWQHHQQSPYRVEKARIRYLFGFMAAAVGFSALEGSDRILNAPQVEQLDLIARSVALQGNLPPVGALFTGLFLFFLYQVVTLERLLDLNEIFARVVTVAATAALLVTVLGVGVFWIQAATGNTVQMTFHLFVSSMLFLLAYEPIRHRVEAQTATWFNLRGHQLSLALQELEDALPKQIDQSGLTQTVLDRLHASGRFPDLSFYVHDTDRQVVRLEGRRGSSEAPPMASVAPKPFSEGFSHGVGAYSRQALARRRETTKRPRPD